MVVRVHVFVGVMIAPCFSDLGTRSVGLGVSVQTLLQRDIRTNGRIQQGKTTQIGVRVIYLAQADGFLILCMKIKTLR